MTNPALPRGPLTPVRLRCEHLENPLGIDAPGPRLSWALEGDGRARRQAAYHILVASDPALLASGAADLWDSGWVESGESALVPYGGAPLGSRTRAWWTVRVRDESDQVGEGAVAWWETGLLKPGDWSARWVGLDQGELRDLEPCPHLRTTFRVGRGLRRARLYATARGVYEARLNGERIGDALLSPGWTDYSVRVQYQTFDVTGLLDEGENVLGATLGDGWYCGQLGWIQAPKYTRHYGERPQFLAQLELEYDDGRLETVRTDGSWRASTGPVLSSDLYAGESHDARLELPGRDRAGFDDSGWRPVTATGLGLELLVADRAQPVRALETLRPAAITRLDADTHLVDLGQNMVGWLRLSVQGPAGTELRLRFAEVLDADGRIYTENLRSAKQTDTYVLKGGGLEVWEPRFTFHGFRYVEVAGFPGEPGVDSFLGVVVGSDTPPAGRFSCSSGLVNKLQSNIVWGQRGNFLSVPTDCPQRDERLGWLADAQVFARTAMFNADTAAFFSKWMVDVEDAQSKAGGFPDVAPRVVDLADGAPAWGDAGVILPWTLYLHYGDRGVLERHWDAMERWMAYLLEGNPNMLWRERRGNDFGDWLAQDGDDPANAFGSRTPKDLLATAYWAFDASIMAKAARALGREADAGWYDKLFRDIKAEFNREHVSPDGRLEGDTQTAYLLALGFDLLPEALRPQAAEHLVAAIERRNWHLTTGFVGVGLLCPVLTSIGRADVAYRLLLNETFPSWGYGIRRGATTIWERWDGQKEDGSFQDAVMNSFNHYSLGSVGQWLYQSVAGLDTHPDAPGFARAHVRPEVGGGLEWAKASLETARGRFEVGWRLEGGALHLDVTVPVNTGAEVHLPASSVGGVLEGGRPLDEAEGVRLLRRDGDRLVLELGSGSYEFLSPNAPSVLPLEEARASAR